jgi:hypothetical protein
LLNWLRSAELEQVEGPLLIGSGRGHSPEGRELRNRRLDDLLGLGAEGLEDAAEVLDLGRYREPDQLGALKVDQARNTICAR